MWRCTWCAGYDHARRHHHGYVAGSIAAHEGRIRAHRAVRQSMNPANSLSRGAEIASTSVASIGIIPVVSRYRWRICALLFFATAINYMDRQVLGILAPDLQR